MSPLAALYVKELKELRLAAVFALASVGGLGLYVAFFAQGAGAAMAAVGLVSLTEAGPLILPVLLVKSVTREWRTGTHYLLLSLPVGRAWPVLAKVAAHLSLGAALFLVSGLALYGAYVRTGSSVDPRTFVDPSAAWAAAAALYWGLLVLVSGLACAAGVVRLVAPRFEGLASAAVVLAGIYLHAWAKGLLGHDSGGIFETVRWDPRSGFHFEPGEMIASLAVTCAVGFVYVAVGAWVFARRAEA